MMMSHDAEKTVGVFWLNPSEMFIDVSDGSDPVVCSISFLISLLSYFILIYII